MAGDIPSACPGRDGRNLTISETACPHCGYPVEFFSDEKHRKCPSCSNRVERVVSSDCAQWCSAASECSLLHGGASPGEDPA